MRYWLLFCLSPAFLVPSLVNAMSLGNDEQPSESKLARGHAAITQRLQKTASWLDSFFGDEREDDELASSHLRLGISNRFLELEPEKFKIFLRGKVVLPRLERRVQLVFEGTDDSSLLDTEEQKSSSSIRYSIKDTKKKKLSLSTGFRGGLTHPHIFTRLRLSKKINRGDWLTHVIPSLVYDTREGWEAVLRISNEHEIGEDLFFRSTTQPIWADHKDGLTLRQDFTVFKRLSPLRYLAFDWFSEFVNGPHNKLEVTQLRLRHRRAIWRDKMFLEFAPGLRFANEHEHRLQWEGYIKLEMFFTP